MENHIEMEVWMGKSSINGRCSIAIFDYGGYSHGEMSKTSIQCNLLELNEICLGNKLLGGSGFAMVCHF